LAGLNNGLWCYAIQQNFAQNNGKMGGLLIQFREIKLSDKPIFDMVFRQNKFEACECTFTNMFMWRNAFNIQWTMVGDFLCIKAGRDGDIIMLPPYGPAGADIRPAVDAMLDYFAQHKLPFILKGVTQRDVDALNAAYPGLFNITTDRDNWDYVYNAADLISLKGRKYHSKKNHVNSFRKRYKYEYVPLTPALAESCIEFTYEWCRQRSCDQDPLMICERDAVIEALSHMAVLDFVGGVILIDGKVEAFTFGEPLNPEMAVIHVEKANPAYNGIYAVINQEFCQHNWQNMKYINREEDTGSEGLRKAKLSYHPVKMIEKFTITLRS